MPESVSIYQFAMDRLNTAIFAAPDPSQSPTTGVSQGHTLRKQAVLHAAVIREKYSTVQDFPLSPECKRALKYCAEEADHLK